MIKAETVWEGPILAILKDFLNQVTFEEVWSLLAAGGNLTEYRQAYENIFTALQATEPRENTGNMTIRFVEETEPEWNFYFGEDPEATEEPASDSGPTLQVYGFIPGDEEGYAIGLKPPEVLVGLDVDPDTARDFTPAQIVSNCIAEMAYTATMASSAYGTERDTAGGGLLASQVCMSEDIQNIDLEALRQELGALPKPEEDYKTKYGFLF